MTLDEVLKKLNNCKFLYGKTIQIKGTTRGWWEFGSKKVRSVQITAKKMIFELM